LALAGKAAAMAPDQFGYVSHHATLLAQSGRLAEAQIALGRAAALLPDHPVLHYKQMELHELRGDLQSAIEAAEFLVSEHSETFRPALERLRLRERRAKWRRWPPLTFRGRRIFGNPSAPVDVRVTTTPSPPPFVESWVRHDHLMARLPTEPFDVLLVGDSLAEFWPDDLWAPLSVFNFGVRADKTQHALWRLSQLQPASLACRHVVVLLGANNLGAGDTASGLVMGVAAVVAEAVRVAPGAKAHVIATPPLGPDFAFRAEVRKAANRGLAALEGFATNDADAALTSAAGAYEADGIHLTPIGYRRLTDLVRGCLT
jgi:lysophospholipase L1-like esterase